MAIDFSTNYVEPGYRSLRLHAFMLADKARVNAYQEAIRKNIGEGDVVLEIGSGTGILSMLAARQGAKVYAVEPTQIIEIAKENARRNKLDITFINSTIEEADIPENVDFILSELIGIFGVQENLLPLIGHANKYLKPDGKLLPEKVDLYLVPIQFEGGYNEISKQWNDKYGFDLSAVGEGLMNDAHPTKISQEGYLSEPQKVKEIELAEIQSSEFQLEADFEVHQEGYCHGLAGWFTAHFPGGIKLDTSPTSRFTSWQHTYFPIKEEIKVSKGDILSLSLEARVDKTNTRLINFDRDLVVLGKD